MKATPAQRAHAVLALTRYECMDPALPPKERKTMDQQRADLLNMFNAEDLAQLDDSTRNRLRLRRAGTWAAIAFDRSRFQEPAQPAAQRALDELAAVNKFEMNEEDRADYTEAAIRIGAVRWAAANVATSQGKLQVQLQPGEPGQTCVHLVDATAKNTPTLAQRCTYGTVWAASTTSRSDSRALALNVETLDGWTELWVWHQETDGWKLDTVTPNSDGPGLGYVEWAGWSPASRGKLLIVRESKYNGKVTRRFEVLRTNSLATVNTANEPRKLDAFELWADATWRADTVSLR
jgi:hypothetical protein